MPRGVSVIVSYGVAHITPEPHNRGEVVRKLTEVTKLIQVDTSGARKAYIVSEGDARAAGLLDEPKPPAATPAPDTTPAAETPKAPAKAPAKKAAPKTAAKSKAPAADATAEA